VRSMRDDGDVVVGSKVATWSLGRSLVSWCAFVWGLGGEKAKAGDVPMATAMMMEYMPLLYWNELVWCIIVCS
jgi:hypothetical protein